MAGCSLAGGLGTSLVRLELLVLGMGGEPLQEQRNKHVAAFRNYQLHLFIPLVSTEKSLFYIFNSSK